MKHVKPMKQPLTNNQVRARFKEQLGSVGERLLNKFDAGRRKHNNEEIWKLDFDQEILNEILDLIIYTMLKKIIYGATAPMYLQPDNTLKLVEKSKRPPKESAHYSKSKLRPSRAPIAGKRKNVLRSPKSV